MKSIWKSILEVTDVQFVEVPQDAQFLTVQMQNGVPCIWYMVDPHKPKVSRKIRIHGTGYPIVIYPGVYIGTFQMESGHQVFHVFADGP